MKLFKGKLTEKASLGRFGEREAEKYLSKQGYITLERNFRHSHSEIDLILLDGDCTVFCEVRTHNVLKSHYLTPSESISENKKASLSKGASFYMGTHFYSDKCRFDVVEVFAENGKVIKINHIKDAFYKTRQKKKGTGYKLCRK